jgi:histidinol dehydrogenase
VGSAVSIPSALPKGSDIDMKILKSSDPETHAILRGIRDRTFELRKAPPDELWPLASVFPGESATAAVARLLADIHSEGDAAVAKYEKALTGKTVPPGGFRVSQETIAAAKEGASEEFLKVIRSAEDQIARFHQNTLPIPIATYRFLGSTISTVAGPLRRVGILIPTGENAFPSVLLASAVPAKVAEVEEIALAVMPDERGEIPADLLAVAAELEITEIHRLSPITAIAAFAFGTESIPRADMIIGHGDLAVLEARSLLTGRAKVERMGGPCELLIYAGEGADPSWVAADLLAQAEHSPLTGSVLLTEDEAMAGEVAGRVQEQIEGLPTADVARRSLERFGAIVVVAGEDEAVELINELAFQSVEIVHPRARDIADRIRNAGAVFVGAYTPQAVGDYCAGPSHMLPRGGSARFTSGLSVRDFLKETLVFEFTREGFRSLSDTARALAKCEGLPAHSRSIEVREE